MNSLDENLLNEAIFNYSKSDITNEEYEDLYYCFLDLSHIPATEPYLYTMRYMGYGTTAEPKKVMEELQLRLNDKNPSVVGLYYDLFLFEEPDNKNAARMLKENSMNGYTDAYLKNQSHLNMIDSILNDSFSLKTNRKQNSQRIPKKSVIDKVAIRKKALMDPEADDYLNSLIEKGLDGDNEILYYVGRCYENGEHVAVDKNKALIFYKMAADLGNIRAAWESKSLYGEKFDELNIRFLGDMWFKYLKQVADAGYHVAQWILARALDGEEKMKYLEMAAKQGNYMAQFELGCEIASAEGKTKYTLDDAAFWFNCADCNTDKDPEFQKAKENFFYVAKLKYPREDTDVFLDYWTQMNKEIAKYPEYTNGAKSDSRFEFD